MPVIERWGSPEAAPTVTVYEQGHILILAALYVAEHSVDIHVRLRQTSHYFAAARTAAADIEHHYRIASVRKVARPVKIIAVRAAQSVTQEYQRPAVVLVPISVQKACKLVACRLHLELVAYELGIVLNGQQHLRLVAALIEKIAVDEYRRNQRNNKGPTKQHIYYKYRNLYWNVIFTFCLNPIPHNVIIIQRARVVNAE